MNKSIRIFCLVLIKINIFGKQKYLAWFDVVKMWYYQNFSRDSLGHMEAVDVGDVAK